MSTVAPVVTSRIGSASAPPGVRPRPAAAASADTVTLGSAPEAEATETTRGLSGWQKAILTGLGALTLVGVAGLPAAQAAPVAQAASTSAPAEEARTGHDYVLRGKIGWLDRANDKLFPAKEETPQAPARETAPGARTPQAAPTRQASDADHKVSIPILKSLSERGMLYRQDDASEPDSFGRPLDAASAKQRLDEGKPVLVRNPRIGNYEGFYSMVRPGDQEMARHFKPQGDLVRSYGDLHRLNHAEGLTNQNTSRSYSSEQREILSLLRDFEGGVPSPNVNFSYGYYPGFYYWDMWGNYIWTNPGYYEAWQVTPNPSNPALFSREDKGGFLGIGSKPDRLSTYEALQDLEAGKGIRVRTDRGIMHEVRNVEQLRELHELEAR